MFKTSNNGQPFVAPAHVWTDVPDTLLDQQTESNHPYGPGRWVSLFCQISEVGNVGGLRARLIGSLDGLSWDILTGISGNPTEGELTAGDLRPGGYIRFGIEEQDQPLIMAYRYFKFQVMSDSISPNAHAQVVILMYAR